MSITLVKIRLSKGLSAKRVASIAAALYGTSAHYINTEYKEEIANLTFTLVVPTPDYPALEHLLSAWTKSKPGKKTRPGFEKAPRQAPEMVIVNTFPIEGMFIPDGIPKAKNASAVRLAAYIMPAKGWTVNQDGWEDKSEARPAALTQGISPAGDQSSGSGFERAIIVTVNTRGRMTRTQFKECWAYMLGGNDGDWLPVIEGLFNHPTLATRRSPASRTDPVMLAAGTEFTIAVTPDQYLRMTVGSMNKWASHFHTDTKSARWSNNEGRITDFTTADLNNG